MRSRFVTFFLALPFAFFGVRVSSAQMLVDFAKVARCRFGVDRLFGGFRRESTNGVLATALIYVKAGCSIPASENAGP
jgi:hypothetical protein